jgi:N-glycosidase YbiA
MNKLPEAESIPMRKDMPAPSHHIHFYETDKAYGCFSNFSRHPIELDGVRWPTSEHFFQAAKFTQQVDVDAVRNAATPFEAARIGRERQRSFRNDWDDVRDAVMLRALQAKFGQHAELAEILLSTTGAGLVEHTRNDRYWADGGDGSGRNMLGLLLEQVRAQLGPVGTTWCPAPWILGPGIEPSDTYWRMGQGESQLAQALRFRDSLAPAARKHYDMYFPAPEEWRDSW